MFGVASNFRKTHGEAAFRILAQTAFDGADTDKSGKIDTAELRTTLEKLGMKLTEAQTAEVVRQYDADGNHELDLEEFLRLVSELIDGTAKLPMAAKKQSSKLEARGGSAKLEAANLEKIRLQSQLDEADFRHRADLKSKLLEVSSPCPTEPTYTSKVLFSKAVGFKCDFSNLLHVCLLTVR